MKPPTQEPNNNLSKFSLFVTLVEDFASRHKELNTLRVVNVPNVQQKVDPEVEKSPTFTRSLPTAGSNIYAVLAYGIFSDTMLADHVRSSIVSLIRDLANWIQHADHDRPDVSTVLPGMTMDTFVEFWDHLFPCAAISSESRLQEFRRNIQILRKISNIINGDEVSDKLTVQPTVLALLASVLYGRNITLFMADTAAFKVIMTTFIAPVPSSRSPVYIAYTAQDFDTIHLVVPQAEIFVSNELSMSLPSRHVSDSIALVPAYNEGENEILRTYLSFKQNCKEEIMVIFFVDGVLKNGEPVNHGTLQALLNNFSLVRPGTYLEFGKKNLKGLVDDVCSLDDSMNATMEYVGVDHKDPSSLIDLRVWVKKANSGKKQSQLKFFEYLSKRSIQPRFLLFVDSDTRFEDPAVTLLKDCLDKFNTGKAKPELGGVTGEIIVENIKGGNFILGATQYFEYKLSHHLGKRAEAGFGRVSCLAGAFSMFECRALLDPRVLSDFSTDDSNRSLWQYNKKNLGEDRYLTAQLLEAGFDTAFEPRAKSYTVAPDTLQGFVGQRRRWDNSTLVNQIDLIFAGKESIFSLWGGRYALPWIWNAIDFLFMLFMPGTMVLLLASIVGSLLRISKSGVTIDMLYIAPPLLVVLWLLFFLLPLLVQRPWVLKFNLGLTKIICVLVVAAAVLLFTYIFTTYSTAMIVVAIWIFLGPYALTLFIREEFKCMFCGPMFLLMSPVILLFLKFYTLSKFGERNWGTRGDGKNKTAEEAEQTKTQVLIGLAGFGYLVLNIGYIALAIEFSLYYLWVFAALISIPSTTRLFASFALRARMNRYKRLIGTVAMFDALTAAMLVILLRMMQVFTITDTIYDHLYTHQSALIFASIGRAIILGGWYRGLRRSSSLAYKFCVVITVAQVVLIIALKYYTTFGLLYAISAILFTIAEGVILRKALRYRKPLPGQAIKKHIRGMGFYAFAGLYNIIFLAIAVVLVLATHLPIHAARVVLGASSIPAEAILLPIAVIGTVWIGASIFLFNLKKRFSIFVSLVAISCIIYLIAVIVLGQLLQPNLFLSFTSGYYPYLGLLTCLFYFLTAWAGVWWGIHLNNHKQKEAKKKLEGVNVNPITGSCLEIRVDIGSAHK